MDFCSWRECPNCHGIEIYQGKPKVSEDTVFVKFALDDSGLFVKCSHCGQILPAL